MPPMIVLGALLLHRLAVEREHGQRQLAVRRQELALDDVVGAQRLDDGVVGRPVGQVVGHDRRRRSRWRPACRAPTASRRGRRRRRPAAGRRWRGGTPRAAASSAGPCPPPPPARRTRWRGSAGRSPRSGGTPRCRCGTARRANRRPCSRVRPQTASAENSTISTAVRRGALSAEQPEPLQPGTQRTACGSSALASISPRQCLLAAAVLTAGMVARRGDCAQAAPHAHGGPPADAARKSLPAPLLSLI